MHSSSIDKRQEATDHWFECSTFVTFSFILYERAHTLTHSRRIKYQLTAPTLKSNERDQMIATTTTTTSAHRAQRATQLMTILLHNTRSDAFAAESILSFSSLLLIFFSSFIFQFLQFYVCLTVISENSSQCNHPITLYIYRNSCHSCCLRCQQHQLCAR